MNLEKKIAAYDELVQDAKRCSRCHGMNGSIKLLGCDFCEEINLWSYWEGGRDHLDARVLLVGQDWGTYVSDDHIKSFVGARKEGAFSGHYMDDNRSITDRNLAELFESIGYDMRKTTQAVQNCSMRVIRILWIWQNSMALTALLSLQSQRAYLVILNRKPLK